MFSMADFAVPVETPAPTPRRKRRKCLCRGQSLFEMRGEAIGGDHIKPGAGQEHDACFFCLRIHRSQRFKAGDLSADIHIMTFGPQAGFRHLAERMHERTRAMEHRIHFEQSGIQFCGVMQREGATIEVVLLCLGAQLLLIAPRENGTQSFLQGALNDQLTGVSV